MPAPLIKPLTADDVPHLIEALRLRIANRDAVAEQLLDHLEQAIGVAS